MFKEHTWELKTETIRREVERLSAQYMVDLRMFDNVELTKIEDEVGRRLIYEMVTKVCGKKFVSKTISFPKDWKESLKQRFLPQWALQKWPVKLTEVTIEGNAYHPDVRIPDGVSFVEIITSRAVTEM